jgi:hypothetical protein
MPVWLEQVRYTLSHEGQAATPLSLSRTIAALLGAERGSTTLEMTVLALRLVWFGLVGAYFVFPARPRPTSDRPDLERFCDVLVLLLAPLPFSSWLVPYHALVMLPAFVLILSRLIDKNEVRSVRTMAAVATVGCALVQLTVREWDLRAGGLPPEFHPGGADPPRNTGIDRTAGCTKAGHGGGVIAGQPYFQFRRSRIARPITQSLSLSDRNGSSSVNWVMRCR